MSLNIPVCFFLLFFLSLSLPRPSLCGVKIADVHKAYLGALFLAYLLQFQNPSLVSSPLLSLLIGSVLARYFQVELAALSNSTPQIRIQDG